MSSCPSARVGGKSVKSRCFGNTRTAEGSQNRFGVNMDTGSPTSSHRISSYPQAQLDRIMRTVPYVSEFHRYDTEEVSVARFGSTKNWLRDVPLPSSLERVVGFYERAHHTALFKIRVFCIFEGKSCRENIAYSSMGSYHLQEQSLCIEYTENSPYCPHNLLLAVTPADKCT